MAHLMISTRHALAMLFLALSNNALSQTADPAVPIPHSPATSSLTETALDLSALKYSNKWRIQFDNRAKSDGILVFRITEKATDPILIHVAIKKGTRENNIADAVKLAIRKALPRNFKTEGDDGEDVLVKHNFWEKHFSIELVSNDVEKVTIKLSKE
jgi:hypothetical protein